MFLEFKLDYFIKFKIIFFLVIISFIVSCLFLNEKITNIQSNFKSCNPLHANKFQFYTKINGEIYPKTVPLYLNTSINFECLNASQIINFLFWNKKFHDKEWEYGLGIREPFV